MAHLKYSIVIPCHNEAGNIGRLIDGLADLRDKCEVIVVDDGSTDGTAEEVGHRPWVTCIRSPSNQGKGRALGRGIREAKGDFIVFMDGDGQDPPDDVPRLIAAAEEGTDFVIGSKFIGTLEPGAISPLNHLGNRLMSLVVNLLFKTRVTDSQSGFRCIRADFLRSLDLGSAEYEVESEMLLRAVKAGLSIGEVPVRRRARGSGRTGFRQVRDGLRIFQAILRERFFS